MVVEAFSILLLLSITIILGYIGLIVFERTKIPDIIWLMILGLILGPVLQIFPTELFIGISSLMAALALIILLYDAGLNMDFYQMIKGVPRGTLMSLVNLSLSMAAIGAFSMFVFGFDSMQGLLLGAIVGGTSSPIVITIMRGLNVRPNVQTLLQLESILTDPFTIVIALALLEVIRSGAPISSTVGNILSAFSIAIVVGSIVGIVWLSVLDKLKGRPFDYMLTLALLFILYVFTESVKGSGALAVLAFGIVLGNSKVFSRMFRLGKIFTVDALLKKFHTEISFFIRSFFFVYMGLIVAINPQYVLYGLAITVILLFLRAVGVRIATLKMALTPLEANIAKIMGPRGLAAAVLAQLPLVFGLPGAEIYSNIAFVVILGTVVYTSIMTGLISKRAPVTEAPPAEEAAAEKPKKPRKKRRSRKR
ncbi:MAG: cation:proton antiporter [Candidatus Aenigmatarchaeota archaeon]